jgi:hypothetical protein
MASHEIEPQIDQMQDTEKNSESFRETSSLVLSEEQALAKARSSPDDALPIIVSYALDDPDNPRHWPKMKKWYITCLVSMLNVFTYVRLFSLPLPLKCRIAC